MEETRGEALTIVTKKSKMNRLTCHSLPEVRDIMARKEVRQKNTTELRNDKAVKNEKNEACYDCDQCDHVATKKELLKLHVQGKHEGLRFQVIIAIAKPLRS